MPTWKILDFSKESTHKSSIFRKSGNLCLCTIKTKCVINNLGKIFLVRDIWVSVCVELAQ